MGTEVKWYGDEYLADLRNATSETLFEVAEKFIEVAASRAPSKDGDLKRSGYVKSESKSTYTKKKMHRKEVKAMPGAVLAGFAAFYAHMVEFGTKPHKIGKPGKRLKMPDGNIVRGPIEHPGTPPKPFIRPTVDEAKSTFGDMVATGIKGKVKFKK